MLGMQMLRTRVCFDDVTFGYQPGLPVLKNISFDVKPGETVALVGLVRVKPALWRLLIGSTMRGRVRCESVAKMYVTSVKKACVP